MLLLALFFFCFQGLLALSTFNVTLPEPNAPFVAGQMLPISYTLPDDPNLSRSKINKKGKKNRLFIGL